MNVTDHLGDYPAALEETLQEVQGPLALTAYHMTRVGVNRAGPGQTPVLLNKLLDQTDVVPVTKCYDVSRNVMQCHVLVTRGAHNAGVGPLAHPLHDPTIGPLALTGSFSQADIPRGGIPQRSSQRGGLLLLFDLLQFFDRLFLLLSWKAVVVCIIRILGILILGLAEYL